VYALSHTILLEIGISWSSNTLCLNMRCRCPTLLGVTMCSTFCLLGIAWAHVCEWARLCHWVKHSCDSATLYYSLGFGQIGLTLENMCCAPFQSCLRYHSLSACVITVLSQSVVISCVSSVSQMSWSARYCSLISRTQLDITSCWGCVSFIKVWKQRIVWMHLCRIRTAVAVSRVYVCECVSVWWSLHLVEW